MKKMIMPPLLLDQKDKRKIRALVRLMIPSNLMAIWPIEFQDMFNMNLNCVLNIINASFIDVTLIERCKSIVIFTSVLLAMLVFSCLVINYPENERMC